MCRSIKKLRRAGEPPTHEELYGAALQFVRKISGYHAPSQSNRAAFDRAVTEVADVSQRMFDAFNAVPKGVRVAQHE